MAQPPACECLPDPLSPSQRREAKAWQTIRDTAPDYGEVKIIFNAGSVRDWHVTSSHKPGPSEQEAA